MCERGDNELDTEFKDVLDDYAEILCEAQADMLAKNKPKTRMDKHLADVSKSIERLAPTSDEQSYPSIDDYKQFTLEDARTLEKNIDEQIEALSHSSDIDDEKEPEDIEDGNSSPVLGCDSVEKQGFLTVCPKTELMLGGIY